MAIGTDFEVLANGDIRHVSGTATYTVLEFHRWLQDLADDAVASGDDLLDITDLTPSERSTDNIITLDAPYNITDTEAEFLYDGSITQTGGDVVYSGLVVVGAVSATTELQIVQNDAILTSYWSTGLNASPSANILLRIMVKTRTAGADIDGKRIRVQARELGDTYAEFSATLGQGNSTAAIFTSSDLNNQTAAATIAAWALTNTTEGYIGIDVNGDTTNEFYYSQWNRGARSINDLYEFTKWIQRRGTVQTLYDGLNGFLFRGITHEITVDGPTGTFNAVETVTWATGTGKMLAINSPTAATKMWIQLLTGTVPVDNDVITGSTSLATATVNVTITARTVSPAFLGNSTGSAVIGAYGVGIESADLSASDLLFDLTNTPRNPPNNVSFVVGGLVASEDYVLVGPESGGLLDTSQFALNTTLNAAGQTAVVVGAAIPTDTPSSGTIRVKLDSGIYRKVSYTSYTGSTFTTASTDWSGVNAATSGNDVFISYIDTLAGATSTSFTSVFLSSRSLFIRVRDGGGTPIKTFETTGTLGSAGGSTTAIRTSDA